MDYPPGLPPFMCTTCQEDLTWQEYELQQTTCAHCQEPDDGLESPPPQPLPPLADIVDPDDAAYTALITEAHQEAIRTGNEADFGYVHWEHRLHLMKQEVQLEEQPQQIQEDVEQAIDQADAGANTADTSTTTRPRATTTR